MPFKLSDPVSECRRRAADYGRRARTVIEIERFLEMDRRGFPWPEAVSMRSGSGSSLLVGRVVASHSNA